MLILASASISRKNLLENADINFIQIPSSFDESLIKENNVKDLALKLASFKAESVMNNLHENNEFNSRRDFPSIEILGSDSIFEFEGKAFGKPRNKEEAYKRWIQMSSGIGYLHTGHALLFCDFSSEFRIIKIKKKVSKVITSKISFGKLDNKEIIKYVNTLEPLNCAGGFALEGKGGKFIEKIDGCFSNVMGLSLPWLRKELLAEGIIA